MAPTFSVAVLLLWLLDLSVSDYSGYGNFSEIPPVGTLAYYSTIRRDYKFRLVNLGDPFAALSGTDTYQQAFYFIEIRIEPCKNPVLAGGFGDLCCQNTGVSNCQDLTTGEFSGSPETIVAGPDLQFAYQQNAHISTCDGTDFEDDPNCGTFMEVHRAMEDDNPTTVDDFHSEILADVKLSKGLGTFQTAFVSTQNLCAGDYELWWVVRTRSGPYVQFREPFTVSFPKCTSTLSR